MVEKLRSHKPHSVAKKREGGLQAIVNVKMIGDGYHETPNSGEDGLFPELSSQDGISHWDRRTQWADPRTTVKTRMGIFAASDFLVTKKEQCRQDGCLISVDHEVVLKEKRKSWSTSFATNLRVLSRYMEYFYPSVHSLWTDVPRLYHSLHIIKPGTTCTRFM